MNERQEKSSLAHMAMSVARERRPDENLLFTPGEKVIDVVYNTQIGIQIFQNPTTPQLILWNMLV